MRFSPQLMRCFLSLCHITFACAVWAQDAPRASVEVRLQPGKKHTSPPVVTALTASNDGLYIAAAGDDHCVRLIDRHTGTVRSTLKAHTDWIQALAFSTDARVLYSGGDDGRVLRWDYTTRRTPVEIVKLPFAIRSISLATDKQLLAVAGFGETVGIWDLAQSNWKYRFSCSSGDQRCVKFSPSASKLLCGGRNGEIRVWELTQGELIAQYSSHSGRIHTAAFSSDETLVTSVGEDRKLLQFDILKKQSVIERELQGAKLLSMCLINDHLVAAAGSDNTIHIYDMLADVVLGKLRGHTGSVAVMCTSGNALVSGAFDTTVRIWDLPTALEIGNKPGRPVGKADLKRDRRVDIR